jgi:hypothetical protein
MMSTPRFDPPTMRTAARRRASLVLSVAALAAGVIFASGSPAAAATGTFGPETFGVYSFESAFDNADHSPATQAGSHPYALTTTIVFNHTLLEEEEETVCRQNLISETEECVPSGLFTNSGLSTYGDLKDLEVNLPPGFTANPDATSARCTEAAARKARRSVS